MDSKKIAILKGMLQELELMAKYNLNSQDYERYSALFEAIQVLEAMEGDNG